MKWLKFIIMLIVVIGLTACGTDDSSRESNDNAQPVNGSEESAEISDDVTNKENGKGDVIREEAAYIGQVDSNSIQVNTEFEMITLQVGEVKDVNWSSIEKNAQVIVEYYKNEHDQHILTTIKVVEEKKTEENKAVVIREEAAYVGQVDSNSIQVNTEFQALTLQVEKVVNVNWSKLEANAHVIIEYIKNNEGQYVLQHLEVVSEKKTDEKNKEVIREAAAYVGQVNTNSIQVNTEMQTLTLKIGEVEDVNWSNIEQNAQVIVEYYKNSNDQYVLTKIEVK